MDNSTYFHVQDGANQHERYRIVEHNQKPHPKNSALQTFQEIYQKWEGSPHVREVANCIYARFRRKVEFFPSNQGVIARIIAYVKRWAYELQAAYISFSAPYQVESLYQSILRKCDRNWQNLSPNAPIPVHDLPWLNQPPGEAVYLFDAQSRSLVEEPNQTSYEIRGTISESEERRELRLNSEVVKVDERGIRQTIQGSDCRAILQRFIFAQDLYIVPTYFREQVKKARDPWFPLIPFPLDFISNVACHQVMNGLFLGRDLAFAEVTGLFGNSNPLGFRAVVTVCPMNALKLVFGRAFPAEPTKAFGQALKERNVEWHNVGSSLLDAPEAWYDLMHNCTFPSSPLTQEGEDLKAVSDLRERRMKVLVKASLDEIFEPILQVIDRAVFGGVKTLFHCQAGISRSATPLLAWLIKRLNLTAPEAILLLRQYRLCINPARFLTQLNFYKALLDKHRAAKKP